MAVMANTGRTKPGARTAPASTVHTAHEEHQDRLEWLGLDSAGQFDPAAFDPVQANTALSRLPAVHVGILRRLLRAAM